MTSPADLREIWPAYLDDRMTPERVIASGGFASVARAHHKILQRAVAVKILHPEHVRDAQVRSRFLQEAQVISRLDHPNIVRVLEYGTDETHAWIVLPFIEGESLRARITREPIGWREASRMGREIASAMQVIHAAGVVHRDLKPENVLLDPDQRALITDFGMSKPRRSGVVTGAGMILGTPGYIAPEAVKDAPVSPASDMYSLGVVLFEVVAGFRPFEREDPRDPQSTRTRMEELMAARETEPPKLIDVVKDVPRSLDGLVTRLIEPTPTDRPRAEQVIEELAWIETGAGDLPEGALSTMRVTRPGSGSESRQTSSPQITGPRVRPNFRGRGGRPLWAIALLAVLAVNVLVGLFLLAGRFLGR